MADNAKHDINSVLEKIDQYKYDYEKRYITTIGIFSSAGLAFCYSTSRSFSDSETFLLAMLPTLWSFVIALSTSGLVLVFKRNEYSYIRKATYHRGFLNKISPSNTNFETVNDKVNKYSKTADFWKMLANLFMWVAAVTALVALVWPLCLLTKNGYIA